MPQEVLLDGGHVESRGDLQAAADLAGATPIGMDELPGALQKADVVVSATGANGVVITADDIATAMRLRPDRALVVVDLALPHDTEPEVGSIDSVTRIDLAALAHAPGAAASQSVPGYA